MVTFRGGGEVLHTYSILTVGQLRMQSKSMVKATKIVQWKAQFLNPQLKVQKALSQREIYAGQYLDRSHSSLNL